MKITKNEEVLSALVRWEAMISTLARDHKEVLSERVRTALLVRILPDKLQGRVHEQLDRLTTYKSVYDKVVSLAQSSAKYTGDEMDCNYMADWGGTEYESGSEHTEYHHSQVEDINSLGKGGCFRCGGFGHIARDCSTLEGKRKRQRERKGQRKRSNR